MRVTITDTSQNDVVELRINGQLPPCGAIEQGAEVELPDNYLALARHNPTLIVREAGAAPDPAAPSSIEPFVPFLDELPSAPEVLSPEAQQGFPGEKLAPLPQTEGVELPAPAPQEPEAPAPDPEPPDDADAHAD